jgi:hypothetical protein
MGSIRWRCWCPSWCSPSACRTACSRSTSSCASSRTASRATRPRAPASPGLLIPGTLALVTAFVSFITLMLIPIPMVRELAITASLGVGYKIVTNLVMLPLAASYVQLHQGVRRQGQMLKREQRARPGCARWRAWPNRATRGRDAGDHRPCSRWRWAERTTASSARCSRARPELRAEARFNRDAVAIASSYDTGPRLADRDLRGRRPTPARTSPSGLPGPLRLEMQPVPGRAVGDSYAGQLRQYNEGYNEGNPKMAVVPGDPGQLRRARHVRDRPRAAATMRKDCSMTAVHLFLADHKAKTINGVIDAVKAFREQQPLPGLTIRWPPATPACWRRSTRRWRRASCR